MEEPGRARALHRLKAVEGQVRGWQQMLDDGRYCVDVLMQIAATQEALRGVAKLVMSPARPAARGRIATITVRIVGDVLKLPW